MRRRAGNLTREPSKLPPANIPLRTVAITINHKSRLIQTSVFRYPCLWAWGGKNGQQSRSVFASFVQSCYNVPVRIGECKGTLALQEQRFRDVTSARRSTCLPW